MDITIQFIITVGIGLITGFIGAITGSGGVISIPFLIFLGLPPAHAIATERFASIGQHIATIRNFIKNKKVIWKYFFPFLTIIVVSTVINTFFLITISEKALKIIIICLMIVSLFIVVFSQNLGLKERKISKEERVVGYVALAIITFISAFIGGLGILKYIVIAYFFGTTYIKANATQRIPWAIAIFITTIFLAFEGYVNFVSGFALFIGYFFGGHIGALTGIKKGNKWVKDVFVAIIIISTTKYIFF